MRTVRSSSRPGGRLYQAPPQGTDPPAGAGTPPPPVDRITEACENITSMTLQDDTLWKTVVLYLSSLNMKY